MMPAGGLVCRIVPSTQAGCPVLLLNPLEPHAVAVKCEAAFILYSRRFHRHDNPVAGARDCASSQVTKTVFPFELQRVVASDLCLTAAIRCRAVSVFVGGIERNLDCVC